MEQTNQIMVFSVNVRLHFLPAVYILSPWLLCLTFTAGILNERSFCVYMSATESCEREENRVIKGWHEEVRDGNKAERWRRGRKLGENICEASSSFPKCCFIQQYETQTPLFYCLSYDRDQFFLGGGLGSWWFNEKVPQRKTKSYQGEFDSVRGRTSFYPWNSLYKTYFLFYIVLLVHSIWVVSKCLAEEELVHFVQ